MQQRDNPYTPGAGRKPPCLAGRDGDLEEFHSLIESLEAGKAERSFIYFGLRGVGKTVLLMEFDTLASEAGWATTDVQEVGSQPDFRAVFAQMAARLLREISRKHRIQDRVAQALGVVKAFSVVGAGGVGVKLDVEARSGKADSGDPEQDLVELLREVGEVAASAHTGVLFLIDEMQNLDSASLAAICMAFQAVSRTSLPVAMVGAGLPDLQVRLMKAKPYADRLFVYRNLGQLRPPEAFAALIKPASDLGVEIEHDAADEVVRLADSYPYFIQEYGRELWKAAETSPITSADLDDVRDLVHDQLASAFYGPRFKLATESEQRYLAAMASLTESPYATAAVASAWGATNQRRTSPLRDGLIDKGLIWAPDRGKVAFTVPLFAEYVRERHPLRSFTDPTSDR